MQLKLADVSRVKKAKTFLVIPNVIEICMVDVTRHVFTSFLSQNGAYNQICDLLLIARALQY
jgi:hypothetical protein